MNLSQNGLCRIVALLPPWITGVILNFSYEYVDKKLCSQKHGKAECVFFPKMYSINKINASDCNEGGYRYTGKEYYIYCMWSFFNDCTANVAIQVLFFLSWLLHTRSHCIEPKRPYSRAQKLLQVVYDEDFW